MSTDEARMIIEGVIDEAPYLGLKQSEIEALQIAVVVLREETVREEQAA